MPTLVDLDSFQHQVLEVFNSGAGAWYLIPAAQGSPPAHAYTDITFDTAAKRTADHTVALQMDFNTTRASQVRKTFAGGAISVASFYIRCDAAPSTALTVVFRFGGPTNADIGMTTSGFIQARIGAGAFTEHDVNVADGAWHRIDAKYDRTTTSGTLDVQVDGDALTQVTGTVGTGNATDWNIAGTAVAEANCTIYYSDMVVSNTSGDYPIGDHICLAREINGTGTHSPGSGAFTDQAGGTSDAALLAAVDDAWDGTTPDLDQTGEDYVQQTANDGAGYVDFTIANARAEDTSIWAVELSSLFTGEDSTTACTGETRLVHSGTTYATTGLVDPSGSLTVYNGYRTINSTTPGGDGWSDTEFNAITVRLGFSTDAAPDVAFNSALVEYASPWSAAAPAEFAQFHHPDRSIYPGPTDA